MNAQSAAASFCPSCRSPLAPEARFCGGCGASTAAGGPGPGAAAAGGGAAAAAAPPFNPSFGAASGMNRLGGRLGSAGATQAQLGVDAATAYRAVLQAIESSGAQVQMQSAPYSVRYVQTKKDFMNTGLMRVNFIGEVSIAPAGPRQCTVRIECKPENLTPVIGMQLGAGLIFGLSMGMQGIMLGLLLGGGCAAWSAYNLGSSMPKSMAEKLLTAIQMGAQAQAAMAPQPPPAPQAAYGAPFTAPGPQSASAGPTPAPQASAAGAQSTGGAAPAAGSDEGADVVTRMRTLNVLREMGVVSDDEYAAKKAELLRNV